MVRATCGTERVGGCVRRAVARALWHGALCLLSRRNSRSAPVDVAAKSTRRVVHAESTAPHLNSFTEIPKIAHSDWSTIKNPALLLVL